MDPQAKLHVIGIGASAGGLEPLQAFLSAASADAGHAYVVVQHLSPDFKSLMPELLRRHTSMPVLAVTQDVALQPDTVHVLTPGLLLTLEGEVLRTHPRQTSAALDFPISTLFESMSALGPRAVAIVLSGTGSDGTTGAQSVHAAGGLVIAQAPGTARFEAMPRGVIDSGCADIVTSPEQMPRAIAGWIADPVQGRHFGPRREAADNVGGEYGPVLSILKVTYNIDFEHYKPGTIIRRIERRLAAGPVPLTAAAYAERLAADRDELERLFGDLLVGVTRFFRDEEMYLQLQSAVLEPAIEAVAPQDEVRIWSCGCSTGEEAYSLAMLAIETFERHGQRSRLRVLATDLHGAALQQASHGLYTAESLQAVPEDLRQRHFVLQPSGLYKVGDELRRAVIFSAHNVLQDAAFTRIDIVSCRNMLIYFQPQAQKRALAAFHFALRPGGALFLGESEGVNELPGAFEPVSREAHVFRKLPGSRVPAELRGPMLARGAARLAPAPLDLRAGKRLDELIMQRYLPDCLLVNSRFELLHVYGSAQRFLHPSAGRFAGELPGLLRPPLRTAVTLALRKSAQSGDSVSLPEMLDPSDAGVRLAVTVDPLVDRSLPQPHYMVRIAALAGPARAGGPAAMIELPHEISLQAAHVEDLEAELARVREALQSTIEELESANEELQAGNEELMAANEELQSTNEELHAVNEELYSVNAEHESKISELRDTTADLNNLIVATELAILFLDSDLRLRMFTPPAAALFPLQPRDVGRALLDFMPLEPDATLVADLRRAGAHAQADSPLDIADREFELNDGRWLRRRITAYRDANQHSTGLVLTYVDVSEQIRLRRESAGRAEQALLEGVARALPDLLCKLDGNGRLEWVSSQLEAYTGVAAESLCADPAVLDERIHADDRRSVQAARAAALANGEPAQVRYRLVRHDGQYRWFVGRTTPQRDADGRITSWLAMATDVHELIETERRLAESEQFLRLAADNANGTLSYWDAQGICRFANRQHLQWFGKPPEQIVGRPAADLLGPELWSLDQPRFAAALQGRAQTFERELALPDGSVRHCLAQLLPDRVDGTVRGLFLTVTDVTTMQEARRSLEVLLDALPTAVLLVDGAGRIVRANGEAARLVGTSVGALVGQTVEELIPEASRSRHQGLRLGYQQASATRQMGQMPGMHFELLRADGTTIEVDVALAPCIYMGRPCVITVIRDLRRFALMNADKADRAEIARGTFLATMSHEIRTPLNAIMGLSQLLELEQPSARQLDRIKGIGDASRHLLEIVNDVLDLTQIESGHLRLERSEFAIADVVARSMAMVADKARLKQLELSRSIDAALPAVMVGDARRIEQVLVNLLANAVKFTAAGSVGVHASGRAVEGRNLMLRIEVQDSGIGISPQAMQQLFKPFGQLDQSSARRFGGTGLGLAISRHLARAMGGDCSASSVSGVGSRFWFTALVERAERGGPASSGQGALSEPDRELLGRRLRGRRLLLVEDDRVNQVVLVEMLGMLGVEQVSLAEDGREAVDTVAAGGVDLVFMDVQLPGMDGLEATRCIHRLGLDPRPPIVAITANVLPEDVARCLEAGMDSHLPKPVTRDDLARTLLRWLPHVPEPPLVVG